MDELRPLVFGKKEFSRSWSFQRIIR